MSQMGEPSKRFLVAASTAAWLIYLAADFMLHAVLLAAWWRATEAYWLSPLQLFQLIPLAYASFAIYCIVLSWLLIRLFGPRPSVRQGMLFGAVAGLLYGATAILGNFSVISLPVLALVVWPVSTMIESLLAGGASAWVFNASHPWRRVAVILGIALLLLMVGILLQNVFFPSAAKPPAPI